MLLIDFNDYPLKCRWKAVDALISEVKRAPAYPDHVAMQQRQT
jgi:hypothetical protein